MKGLPALAKPVGPLMGDLGCAGVLAMAGLTTTPIPEAPAVVLAGSVKSCILGP